jgi:hypothetical protein
VMPTGISPFQFGPNHHIETGFGAVLLAGLGELVRAHIIEGGCDIKIRPDRAGTCLGVSSAGWLSIRRAHLRICWLSLSTGALRRMRESRASEVQLCRGG